MEKLKAVLHIDELEKWQLTLTNAKNFLADVGAEQVVLEIVANAAAVKIFAAVMNETDNLLQLMRALASEGVNFVVCRNALRANAIQEALLPTFVTIVPAGITRIVTRQAEGYSYVKP